MKKTILFLCVLFALANFAMFTDTNPVGEVQEYKEPEVFAPYALLIDEDNDQILYQKAIHERLYPASTTKIITAMIALDRLELDKKVVIGDIPPFVTGSKVVMDIGEIFTVEQLLYGLMVESGNDCAAALAIEVAGSIEAFSKMMNEKAHELGAVNSHFVNPHGLPDENHFTTAHDMYLIAREAMKNNMFRKIVATPKYQIPPTNKQSETRYLFSTNKLFYGLAGSDKIINVNGNNVTVAYPPVIGIKTGWTEAAGRCLVSAASENGRTVYALVFGSDNNNIHQDVVRLLDYGLKGFKKEKIYTTGDVVKTITLDDSEKTKIRLIGKKDLYLTIPNHIDNPSDYYSTVIKTLPNLSTPIDKTNKSGDLVISTKNGVSISAPLYSDAVIKGVNLINDEININKSPLKINYKRLIISFIGIIVLYILFNLIYRKLSR